MTFHFLINHSKIVIALVVLIILISTFEHISLNQNNHWMISYVSV